MVRDRSLQYVDDAWPVSVVVNRAEDASRLDGHHTHSELAPCQALDLRAKVNRRKQLRCKPAVPGAACSLLIVLSCLSGPARVRRAKGNDVRGKPPATSYQRICVGAV